MAQRSDLDVGAIMRDGRAIDRAMIRATIKAIRLHRAFGVPMVVVRDGKVVHVPADEMDEKALIRALEEI